MPNDSSERASPSAITVELGLKRPASSPVLSPGRRIGPYTLLDLLGEGGMGSVYLAEQDEPVRRQVALKLIRADLSGRAVARFEAERQALALMDHPNIAKILDAGSTLAGRPYVVMELVQGGPITRYCTDNGLPARARLSLFLGVCAAVQHAHQKGVIHRDLKPSNVLVSTCDGVPVPKIIDFGIAKAVGPDAGGASWMTETGCVVGTPEYMAPEQTRPDGAGLDTRTDVYALGVILYELLTGITPFTSEQLRHCPREMLRLIHEVEPPRPSVRVLPDRARSRRLRGELDWIVMRCLEKNPARRYQSARDLALDVQRHLADEPVQAGPPSIGYRALKLLRRHRGPALAATAALLALVAGAVGTGQALVRALRAETRAVRERDAKEAALVESRHAGQQALDALRALTDRAIGRQLARQPRLTREDRAFLDDVLARFDRFAAIKGDALESRLVRAEGHFGVGLIRMRLGEWPDAASAYEQARAVVASVVDDFPDEPFHRLYLARIRNNLGICLKHLGRLPDAEKEFRATLALRERLVAESSDDPTNAHELAMAHENLAGVLRDLGSSLDAEAEYRRAIDRTEKLVTASPSTASYRQSLARTLTNLAALLQLTGKVKEPEAEFRRAIDLLNALRAADPTAPDYREELARGHNNLSNLHVRADEPVKAEAQARLAVGLLQELVADFPNAGVREDLAGARLNLGRALAAQGKRSASEAEYRAALALLKPLVADFPAVPSYRRTLATTHNNLGGVLQSQGRKADALAEYRGALDVREKMAASFPPTPTDKVHLGGNYCNIGVALDDKPREALPWYDRAVQTLRPVLDRDPRNSLAASFLRNSYLNRATARERLSRYKDAVADYDRALTHVDVGNRLAVRVRRVLCLAWVEPAEAVAEAEDLLKDAPAIGVPRVMAARVYSAASSAARDPKVGKQYLGRALDLLRQARDLGHFREGAHVDEVLADPHLAPLRREADLAALARDWPSTPKE